MANEKKYRVTIHRRDGNDNDVGQYAPNEGAALQKVATGVEVEIDEQGKVTTPDSDITHLTVVEDPNMPIHHEDEQ